MIDLDRILARQKSLSDITDSLNEAIKDLEVQLLSCRIGVRVSVTVPGFPEGGALSFAKHNTWGLWYEKGSEIVRLINTPRSVRLAAAAHFHLLIETVPLRLEEEIDRASAALATTRQFTEQLAAARKADRGNTPVQD